MMKHAIMLSAFAAQLASGEVVELTPQNFDEVTGKGKALVKFFAPWCGHCKNMAPHYATDSETVEEGVVLAQIDCDEDSNRAICEDQKIQGFPTLKWFHDGEVVEYDGGRGEGDFKKWTSEQLKPAVHEVTELPEDIKENEKIQLTLQAATLSPEFEKVAKANRKHAQFNFMKVEEGWLSSTNKIVVSKHGESNVESTDVSEEGIKKLVSTHRFPLFGELNAETYGDYMQREDRDLLWTLLKYDSASDFKPSIDAAREGVEAVAKNHDKFSFTFTDTVTFAEPIEGMLGIKPEHLPAVVIVRGKKKFMMKNTEVLQDTLESFVSGVEDGTIKPDIKSEPVPESNDGPVRTVVATTMEEELFREDKDVLVKVYAPWCGHCKTMAPEYIAAGEALKTHGLDDKVVLAELDGAANDSTIDSMEWNGFPTLFWIKKGTKEVLPYTGPRDKIGILSWINENSDQGLNINTEAIEDAEFDDDLNEEL